MILAAEFISIDDKEKTTQATQTRPSGPVDCLRRECLDEAGNLQIAIKEGWCRRRQLSVP